MKDRTSICGSLAKRIEIGPFLKRLATGNEKIPLTDNRRRLRLVLAHEYRAWEVDWHQVVFSDESRFELWDHDGCIRVRRYVGEHCISECVIERYSGLKPRVTICGEISYHGQSNVLRIEVQHRQLLPRPAYSSDKWFIEHVCDLIGRLLARNPRPAASIDELLLRIKEY
ncbi:transposable element Tc1 transposase [Trichonephila clavipes]|nr:transposable element Tc1 transposase [Trichonephila clavipes]